MPGPVRADGLFFACAKSKVKSTHKGDPLMYPPEGCPPLAGRKRHACHSPPLPVFCPDRPRPLAPGRAAKPLYTLPDRSRLVKQRANAWGHPRVQVSPEHERLSGGAGFFKGRRPLNALLVPFRASEKGPAARGRTPRIPVPPAAHLFQRGGWKGPMLLPDIPRIRGSFLRRRTPR